MNATWYCYRHEDGREIRLSSSDYSLEDLQIRRANLKKDGFRLLDKIVLGSQIRKCK